MSPRQAPMFEMRNLTIRKRRGGDSLVRDVSVQLAPGEILAVVGRSGVGKSSLLNVVAGFIAPADRRVRRSLWEWFDDGEGGLEYVGQVHIEGRPIDALAVEERADVGMVMQGGVVYEHLTVLQNLVFPLRAKGERRRDVLRERAEALLTEVDLEPQDIARGVDAFLAGPAHKLSGGERQRVALARVLAKNPKVFLLDEAFANLDPILREQLFRRFAGLITGDRCGVVVTHDLSDLRYANQVLLLGHQNGSPPGHRYYRRDADGFSLLSSADDGSDYWEIWHERIVQGGR